MKNHVVSLKLAKKMKELGFPQKSEFYWSGYRDVEKNEDRDMIIEYAKYNHGKRSEDAVSAYLATELVEWLPKVLRKKNQPSHNELLVIGGRWFYDDKNHKDGVQVSKDLWQVSYQSRQCIEDKKLVDAMSKMLIYLVENEIINPKEL